MSLLYFILYTSKPCSIRICFVFILYLEIVTRDAVALLYFIISVPAYRARVIFIRFEHLFFDGWQPENI